MDMKRDDSGRTNSVLWIAGLSALAALLVLLVLWGSLYADGGRQTLSAAAAALAGRVPTDLWQTLAAQADLMGLPLQTGSQAYWFLARAGGIVAYLLLWLATCLGIIMSSKIGQGLIGPATSFAWHEYLPILGLVFAALHALVLLGDTYIQFSLWQLLIPFSSSYKPLWTGLGSLAFYLFLALVISFYVRQHIGQRVWRAFHLLSYLGFVAALAHGIMAGSDSGTTAMRLLYLGSAALALFLLFYRMLAYAPRVRRARARPPADRAAPLS